MNLSNIAVKKSKNNVRVIAKMMLHTGLCSRTIENWFKKNSDRLTTPGAIAIIKEETGLSEAQIFKASKN